MNVVVFLIIIFNCCLIHTAENNATVIIIGAGPSGIAAATKLLSNNFHDLLILEAEPRIGGRINSVKFFDAYVDLGAQWCHGQVNNIVYEIVKDMNLLGHNKISQKFYHSSRRPGDEQLEAELIRIMEDIYGRNNSGTDEYKNFGEYCKNEYNKTIYEKFGNNPKKLEFALSTFDFFQTYVIGSEGAFTWYDIAVNSDYEECAGDKLQNWNGKGYKIFLDVLMQKYPDPTKQLPIDDKILLNKEVNKIEWNKQVRNKGIKLWCTDGTVYEADRVIFTPSVGVLKMEAENMFIPKLPEKKIESIKNIGIGAVMKIIMHFPQNWWGNNTDFTLFWNEKDRKFAVSEFPEGPNLNGTSWITYMAYIIETEHNPNVLIAWLTGPLIPAIELLSEQTLINGIYYSLDKFLGHIYNISKPDKIISTRWYSNPHFRGTYSFQTPKAKETSAESILAEPLTNVENKPIILFAGEATNPIHYSTVQGAVESGYREANRILSLIKS